MFCKYCGSKIHNDSVFCAGCGRNITIDGTVAKKPKHINAQNQQPIMTTAPAQPATQVYTPVKEPQYKTVETVPAQESKKNIKPKTKKKGTAGKVLPYILMPIAGILIGLIPALKSALLPSIYGLIRGNLPYDLQEVDIISDIVYALSGITPSVFVILILFSLCCKTLNKKIRFIESVYASQILSVFPKLLTVGIGYIMLYTVGFHEIDKLAIFSTISGVVVLLGLIVTPFISIVWFLRADNKIVITETKNDKKTFILPCVLFVLYGIIYYFIFYLLQNRLYAFFMEELMFGRYGYTFTNILCSTIAQIVVYGFLMTFSILCKGGYKKLSFVGSAFTGFAISSFINSVIYYAIVLILDVVNLMTPVSKMIFYDVYGYIGNCIVVVLGVVIAILLYIYLNRYEVEKIKKKKNNETPDVLSEEKPEPAAVLQQ